METLRLCCMTPQRLVLDEEVEEVVAPGTIGQFGVLPNHINFLTTLEAGVMRFRKGGKVQRIAVSGGYAEVVDNVMTVLADAAEFAEEIDLPRAQMAKQRAETRLRALSPLDPEFIETQAALRRALVRLEAAERLR